MKSIFSCCPGTPVGLVRLGLLAAAFLTFSRNVQGSDHADPLVLNPLNPPELPSPRITDLHIFLDSDQAEKSEGQPAAAPSALVLSLCVFPSMPPLARSDTATDGARPTMTLPVPPPESKPGEPVLKENSAEPPQTAKYLIPDLDLQPWRYQIAVDFTSSISFTNKADLVRYGGTVDAPDAISPTVTIGITLNNDASLRDVSFNGLDPGEVVRSGPFRPGLTNIRTGIFDDPFIFPRFARRNVIGMVISIPLSRLPEGRRSLLAWGSSYRGDQQIDHVGRSQRTQLPRFDALNTLPPRQHVAEINRRHIHPTVSEDFMRTFLSSLFARRAYDAAPDVMIFRWNGPSSPADEIRTLFPNGRKLKDDVVILTAMAGDAQLLEASFQDDPSFPIRREFSLASPGGPGNLENAAETGKTISSQFPYLATPWTVDGVKAFPPGYAISRPDLTLSTWRKLSLWVALLIGLSAWALMSVLRGRHSRYFALVPAIIGLLLLVPVFIPAKKSTPPTSSELRRPRRNFILLGSGAALSGAFLLSSLYLMGRRHGRENAVTDGLPEGGQPLNSDDRQYAGSTFDEVRTTVLAHPYNGGWGGPGSKPLPVYPVSFSTLVRGFRSRSRRFDFADAQQRTLKSRADLRWGAQRKGVRRLLHPNGICMVGDWIMDESTSPAHGTGAFTPGTRAKVIARYSTCCTETRGGHWRSLAMVCKLFPLDPRGGPSVLPVMPANFFTQEDLGGTRTTSIRQAILTNSPPVTPWRRGKGIFSFLLTILTFFKADKMPAERQLYEIAELGEAPGSTIHCPRFIRLTVDEESQGPSSPQEADFREEILNHIKGPGEPAAPRTLTFVVEVSEKGKRTGRLVQRVTGQEWKRIGTMVFMEAAASHNGDFVIHYPHPPWRTDAAKSGTEAKPAFRRTV